MPASNTTYLKHSNHNFREISHRKWNLVFSDFSFDCYIFRISRNVIIKLSNNCIIDQKKTVNYRTPIKVNYDQPIYYIIILFWLKAEYRNENFANLGVVKTICN